MKKVINYASFFCWTTVLLINIITLTRGEQVSSLIAMLATLFCFLDCFVRVIRDTEVTIKVTQNIPKESKVVLLNNAESEEKRNDC